MDKVYRCKSNRSHDDKKLIPKYIFSVVVGAIRTIRAIGNGIVHDKGRVHGNYGCYL